MNFEINSRGSSWREASESGARKPQRRATGKGSESNPLLRGLSNVSHHLPSLLLGLAVGLWTGNKLSKSRNDEVAGDGSHGKGPGGVRRRPSSTSRGAAMRSVPGNASSGNFQAASSGSSELKMVLVVRQDLKMGSGKAAAQCAHAAVGIYGELSTRNQALLRQYEDCGQPKIVVTCKNLQEMNELKGRAQQSGLPTFVVTDAGRTQVAAGSKTVLAIGPGGKTAVDAVTRHLRLL